MMGGNNMAGIMGWGMGWGMMALWALILVLVILGVAALVKYLSSRW